MVAMVCRRSTRIRRTIVRLLLGAAAISSAVAAGGADSQLTAAAREARQVIAVIDWFYVRHRACPQPSHPAELAELEGRLGDGYSAGPQGRFVEFAGSHDRKLALLHVPAVSGAVHAVGQARSGRDPDLAAA
jgi:hypothetical protein